MAMIDYGALLRKNGKFINKDKGMFMESSDTGYICEKAVNKNGYEYNINGDYFVYAGDKDFLIVFYKGIYRVISNGKILYSCWDMPFNSEVRYFEGLPSLKVSRLSKYYEIEQYESIGSWKEYVKRNWMGATGDEKISELQNGHIEYKNFIKMLKRRARDKGFKTRPDRFIAEWDYNENHYEVIFGYGIEPNEEVWDKIKHRNYNFREEEVSLIDSWFKNN